MKTTVRVFPDYMSSGLWEPHPFGCNYDESEFKDIVPDGLMMALKYWHWTWEFCIACVDEDEVPKLTKYGIQMWWEDGERLVELMNAAQDVYEFVYEADKV